MFKNILIPTDGSEQSQRAVRTGVDLAKLHGARVTGIHVIPDYHLLIAYEGAFDPVTEERIEEAAKARADSYLAFIRTAQRVGLSLEEVEDALGTLPSNRTPTKADWSRLSRSWRPRLDAQIQQLERLRDTLDSCIGCGCLSLKRCNLSNPGDEVAVRGPGPVLLEGR